LDCVTCNIQNVKNNNRNSVRTNAYSFKMGRKTPPSNKMAVIVSRVSLTPCNLSGDISQ